MVNVDLRFYWEHAPMISWLRIPRFPDRAKNAFLRFLIKISDNNRGAMKLSDQCKNCYVVSECMNIIDDHRKISKFLMAPNLALIFWRSLLLTSAHFALTTPCFRGGGFFFRVRENKTISHWVESMSDSKFVFRKLEIHSSPQKSGSNVSRILGFANLNRLPSGCPKDKSEIGWFGTSKTVQKWAVFWPILGTLTDHFSNTFANLLSRQKYGFRVTGNI